MKTLEWNARTIITIAVAFLLTASVGAMGVWLLLSGQPGTGMMESGDHVSMVGNNDHAGMMGTTMPSQLIGAPATVAGVRLPGWTGGQGFYLGDGETFVIAKGTKSLKAPPPWQPLILQGRWLSDEFGTSWLQVEQILRIQGND